MIYLGRFMHMYHTKGLISRGEQECIEFADIWLTPNHAVNVDNIWQEAQDADQSRARVYATGCLFNNVQSE